MEFETLFLNELIKYKLSSIFNNLLEKITLYKNYIAFFDQSHINHFNKLINDYDIFKNNLKDNITSSNYLTINDLDEDVLLLDQVDSDDNSNNSSPTNKDISFDEIVHQEEPNTIQVVERVNNDKPQDENITIG